MYLQKSERVCVQKSLDYLLWSSSHFMKFMKITDWSSKILAEDGEREEIQIPLIGGQKPKFQVLTHIVLFWGQ